MGLNTAGAQNWSFSANLSLTFSSGQKASWISNRTNTLTTVGGNMYYMITGSASGISRTGVSYTLTITQALYHTFFPWWLGGCPFIEQGKLTIAKNNGNDIYVNFGTGVGTCSDAATATINNTNYNISQKWW